MVATVATGKGALGLIGTGTAITNPLQTSPVFHGYRPKENLGSAPSMKINLPKKPVIFRGHVQGAVRRWGGCMLSQVHDIH